MDVKSEDERPKRSCKLDDDDENLPFFKELKARELSTKFKMPPMEKYNGRGDSTNHTNVYKMRLQGYIPADKCRNFDTTLVSDAKRYYKKLKPESIRSWPQLN
ncbi:Retrotrans gag domain-containing protein [Abeliophyllum distichum]|uniref:Retrotrans gag domain-containing protein n=1 Tax=Abeliophyllum distichum TaxID=126358 RepID=A0ABD1RDN3_9LAMI